MTYYEEPAEKLQGNEETYTINENKIICPHCGAIHEDETLEYFRLGDDAEICCEECDKEFMAHVEFDPIFSTHRKGK